MAAELSTEYSTLFGVSCLRDKEVWARGNGGIMKLYYLKGELVKSVKTISGNKPSDIAVMLGGDLIYSDDSDNSINIVKNSQIKPLIKLSGWDALGVCCSSCGDILVSWEHIMTMIMLLIMISLTI